MSSPQRREPGIRRRLRLWFVRQTLWERDHPILAHHGYGRPWRALNELAKFSFACDKHGSCRAAKVRYRDGQRYTDKRVAA